MNILDAVSSDRFEELWEEELKVVKSGKRAFDRVNEAIDRAGGRRPYSYYKSFQNTYYRRKNEKR